MYGQAISVNVSVLAFVSSLITLIPLMKSQTDQNLVWQIIISMKKNPESQFCQVALWLFVCNIIPYNLQQQYFRSCHLFQ